MKITAVEAYPIQAAITRPFAASVARGTHTHRSALLVCVRTDEGLVGWGETLGPVQTLACSVRELLAPALLGADPLATRDCWAAMWRAARPLRLGAIRALSALDMALWDLKGQALGLPVAALLGARLPARFPTVATAIFYQPDDDHAAPRVALAERLAAEGYRGIKVKVGGLAPRLDIEHVAAITRAVGPDVMVSVDANCGLEPRTAVWMAPRMEAAGVYWFEEPLPTEHVAGYRDVARATGMLIAAGQDLTSAEAFLPLLEARAVQQVQPNVSVVGGFTEVDRVVGMARAFGARYNPAGWGTSVLMAASLHLRAATAALIPVPFPDLDWIEVDITENPLREAVTEAPLRSSDGWLAVPQAPGLGVQVRENAVRAHCIG